MKRILPVLAVIIGIAAFFIGCSEHSMNISDERYKLNIPRPAGPVPYVSFRLEAPLADVPNKAPVYRMVYPELTTESVVAIGTKFGLTGEVKEDSSGFAMQNEKTGAYLAISKPTGTIRYSISSKIYPKETPLLPSYEEALKITTNFLEERGLLPEGRIANKVDIGGYVKGLPAHLLVSFTSPIHATGPGARMGVRIGNGGEVVEVFINPTNPSKLPIQETISLKPIEQAVEKMKDNKKYYAPPDAKL